MKVIKRDGRAVEFNKNKISIAIEKANTEVKNSERATSEDIEQIIKYIEDIDKKRILVEDIQDIIEQKLMDIKKFNLAKKYIVYRYTRALVRKQNTTDESILGIIKNANIQINKKEGNSTPINVSMQRDLIAGEVSKDLTKRILLPEKITKAHEKGLINFHNAEYFLQPMINSCVVNLEDMLENGTVINNIKIDEPQDFITACNIATQIIEAVASSQYGKQYIDLSCFGKYLRKSKEKYANNYNEQLKIGLKIFIYNINTIITANGKIPSVTVILSNYENDKFEEENELITNELENQIKQCKEEGINIEQPKIMYYDKKVHDLLQNKFDQGKVSINLNKIAEHALNSEKIFEDLLDKVLDICYEALMYRHYALIGTIADVSPIHWRHGAITRLNEGERIDRILKNGKSTLTLSYMGFNKMINLIMSKDCSDKEISAFEKQVEKTLKEKILRWKKETGINFILESADSKYIKEKTEQYL